MAFLLTWPKENKRKLMEIKVNHFFPHLKTLVEVQSAVIYEIMNAFSEQQRLDLAFL